MKKTKTRLAKILLASTVILVATAVSVFADTWQRADVYFTDWDVLTRERWTINKARELAQHKKTFTTDASLIADMLSLQKLKPSKGKHPEDARLVVDLYTDTNHKVTYYASRFRISSADDGMKHDLGGSFREEIRNLFK